MSEHPPQPAFAARITKHLNSALHRARFLASQRHVHGPKQRIATADEVVLVALMRDSVTPAPHPHASTGLRLAPPAYSAYVATHSGRSHNDRGAA